MPAWPDSDFLGLPAIPEDPQDPLMVAKFVDGRVAAGNRAVVRRLTEHMDRRFTETQEQMKQMKQAMLTAFPDENLMAHHAYHQRQNDVAKSMGRLKLHVAATVLGATVLGACGAVGFSLIQWAVALVGKGIP